MSSNIELVERLYDRFNAREMDAVLATMHPDVVWADGLEGGFVYGRDGVRTYWMRQWTTMESRAEPTSFSNIEEGTFLLLADVRDQRHARHATGSSTPTVCARSGTVPDAPMCR